MNECLGKIRIKKVICYGKFALYYSCLILLGMLEFRVDRVWYIIGALADI